MSTAEEREALRDILRSGQPLSTGTTRDLLDDLEAVERWKAEALPVIGGLQELGRALGLPLGARIAGPEAVEAAKRLQERARDMEIERNMLRSTLREVLERAEQAEQERDEWRARRDNAVETCRFRHQEGLTAVQWHAKICGAMQGLQQAEAEVQRLRDGIEALADTADGDGGTAHNYGCEGEPTCLACIVADLRLIASGSDQRLTGGAP